MFLATAKTNNVPLTEIKSAAPNDSLAPLHVRYEQGSVDDLLADPRVLSVIGFGAAAQTTSDPRFLCVGLEPAFRHRYEVWRCDGPVVHGRHGDLRWSSDGNYLFFAIETDEAEAGNIDAAAEQAYSAICQLLEQHRFADGQPGHILRLWNYMDAINEGDGDDERYRHFCSGRARGLNPAARNGYSAATAIGRRDGLRVLQIYGMAARAAGTAVENPRQVSAWAYPRQYGPVSPTFVRATRTSADQLLVSGTAAVVGHQSQHVGDTLAQLDETLTNLSSLLGAAGADIASRGIEAALIKVYLRDPAEADMVSGHLLKRLPGLAEPLILFSDICRRDLHIEIDGIQG
ncbi:MAG TPA: pteridine-dependent deoxygenase [Dokdonella sp.]|uniref:chorismate transformation enzyme, FkbO/Hyg5 family n=1 Tax=Dokdonella sp. TaxID=2291710 RepID=UPI002D7EDC42|nr:pteridine-dependent deoxygenase [Dokdonella sp.]HET9033274.1 pteridine-dependent deoxygenase [Dokdonella sp.]